MYVKLRIMFENKIKSLYPKLTLSETKIADYLLANLGHIPNMSSFELAKKAKVGQASVIRFSKKIGYSNFGMLMKDIVNSKTTDDSPEINLADPLAVMLEKIKRNYLKNIDSAYDSINVDSLEKAAELLNTANNIICFGHMATGGIAEYLAQSLIEVGKKSVFNDSLFKTKQSIRFCDPKKDVVVLISKSGETTETNEIAKFANKENIPVISITNLGQTSLEKLSTVTINFLYDAVRTRLTAYTQTGGLIFVVDALILSLYREDYYKYRDKSKSYRKFTRFDNK